MEEKGKQGERNTDVWETPKGKLKGEKEDYTRLMGEKSKRNVEDSPSNVEIERVKRREDDEFESEDKAFAKSNKIARSPKETEEKYKSIEKRKNDQELKLDWKMMVNMISDKQKEAIENLKDELKERDEKLRMKIKVEMMSGKENVMQNG